MTAAQTQLWLPDADATRHLGRRLAGVLRPGDVLLLSGELGTGKTELARAIIQTILAAAGLAEDVPSPTYTLVQTYSDGRNEIWHADLYRVLVPDEIAELGLEDAFDTAICLIEWPERIGRGFPPGAVWLRLYHDGGREGRLLRIEIPDDCPERLKTVLAEAAHDHPLPPPDP